MGCGFHRRSEAVPTQSRSVAPSRRSRPRCSSVAPALSVCLSVLRHSRTVSVVHVMLLFVFALGFFGAAQAIDTRNQEQIPLSIVQNLTKSSHENILPHSSQSQQQQPHHRYHHPTQNPIKNSHRGATNTYAAKEHRNLDSRQLSNERGHVGHQNARDVINPLETQLEMERTADQLLQHNDIANSVNADITEIDRGDLMRQLYQKWLYLQNQTYQNPALNRQRRQQHYSTDQKEELRQQELHQGWLLYQRYRRRHELERQRQLKEFQRRTVWEEEQQRLYKQWLRLQERLFHRFKHQDGQGEDRDQLSGNHQPKPHKTKKNGTEKGGAAKNLKHSSKRNRLSSDSILDSSPTSTANGYNDDIDQFVEGGTHYSKLEPFDQESQQNFEEQLSDLAQFRHSYSRERSTKVAKSGVPIPAKTLEQLAGRYFSTGERTSQKHSEDSLERNDFLDSVVNSNRNSSRRKNKLRKNISDLELSESDGEKVVKLYRLFNRCSEKFVRLTGQYLDASALPNDTYNKLEIVAHWFSGFVTIRSAATHSLLCFNQNGRLRVQTPARRLKKLCLFREFIEANDHIRFQSAENPDWSIGFRKNGRPLSGKFKTASDKGVQSLHNQSIDTNTRHFHKFDESAEVRDSKRHIENRNNSRQDYPTIDRQHLRIKAVPIPLNEQTGKLSDTEVSLPIEETNDMTSQDDNVMSLRQRRSAKNKKKKASDKCYQFIKILVEEPNPYQTDHGPKIDFSSIYRKLTVQQLNRLNLNENKFLLDEPT